MASAITPFKVIQGHRVWYQSKAHMRLPMSPILHRFRGIRLPLLCLTPPTEGFPWDDLLKILPECRSMGGQGIKWRRKIAENLNPLSGVHERYRRQTDGRTTTYSEREREFTFANKKLIRRWDSERERSRSFKVTEFGTNRKPICDFLVVVNSNLPPILHRFRDIAVQNTIDSCINSATDRHGHLPISTGHLTLTLTPA